MNITKFVSSLLPSFGKERVLEDLTVVKRELSGQIIPEYNHATQDLRGWKYKSAAVKNLQGVFNRMYGQGDMVTDIAKALPIVLKNVEALEQEAEKMTQDVASQGLTYRNANLLQLVEYASFVARYSRKLLMFIITAESCEMADSGDTLSASIPPAQDRWISSNMVSYCQALKTLTETPHTLIADLMAIPEVLVTGDNEEGLSATMGASKIDPFRMNLVPLWLNPIYHIRMHVAEYQAKRYKESQEEVQALQLRRFKLLKLKDGKPDAALDDKIARTESRINKLTFEIDEMEKDYA